MTVTNSIYTHSASWKIRACPFGTEYLNLMLSKRDQDIPSCVRLPTDTEDKQQGKASIKPMDSHKRGVRSHAFIKTSCSAVSLLFLLFCSVCVLCSPAVWIVSDKRAYATETDIQFVAVTAEPDPLYFHWKFGDGPEIKTTSRIYKKRYRLPDKYFSYHKLSFQL